MGTAFIASFTIPLKAEISVPGKPMFTGLLKIV